MTMPRYFWLLADRKTIREISWEEWQQMVHEDWERKNKRRLARLDDSDIYLRKGRSGMWLSLTQLKQMLEEA